MVTAPPAKPRRQALDLFEQGEAQHIAAIERVLAW
jgi:hypothetical protein